MARDELSVAVTDSIAVVADISVTTEGLALFNNISLALTDISSKADFFAVAAGAEPFSVPSLGVFFYLTPAAFAMIDLVTVVDTTLGFVD